MNSRKIFYIILIGVALVFIGAAVLDWFKPVSKTAGQSGAEVIFLPEPDTIGHVTVEAAINARRSIRAYQDAPLTLAEAGQLLWAAQGVTHPGGLRTAPSAGALYPLETYLIVGEIHDLPQGVYRYHPDKHAISLHLEDDQREELCSAALGQECVREAPVILLMTAIYERTTVRYGQRGEQYVHMEVGGAAQNVYLQATALDLGTVFIGAFHDDQVQQVLSLPQDEIPLCIMPVGRK